MLREEILICDTSSSLQVGFFVAGPGGVLGASARSLVGFAGHAKDAALVAAVAGLVNGSGRPVETAVCHIRISSLHNHQ